MLRQIPVIISSAVSGPVVTLRKKATPHHHQWLLPAMTCRLPVLKYHKHLLQVGFPGRKNETHLLAIDFRQPYSLPSSRAAFSQDFQIHFVTDRHIKKKKIFRFLIHVQSLYHMADLCGCFRQYFKLPVLPCVSRSLFEVLSLFSIFVHFTTSHYSYIIRISSTLQSEQNVIP